MYKMMEKNYQKQLSNPITIETGIIRCPLFDVQSNI